MTAALRDPVRVPVTGEDTAAAAGGGRPIWAGGRHQPAARREATYLCWAWHPLHDMPIFPRAVPTALASFFSAASSTAAVFSLYWSVSFFQLSSVPFSGLFLPSASPNVLSVFA